MPMAGPTPAEWLNACTLRAKTTEEHDRLNVHIDDWHNLIAAAQKAYGITDEQLAELNDRG